MKALIKTEPGVTDLELIDMPIPEPGEGEVILKVRAVGICGSDLHMYKWEVFPPLPLIMGHEFCGEIYKVGPGVTGWKEGEFVASNVGGTCGVCQPCREGKSYLCLNKRSPGIFAPGAYAEYVKTYANMLYRVPDNISEDVAACFEPACTVLHGLKRFDIKEGDTVVVSGVGLIGLLAIHMIKRIYKAGKVMAIGIDTDEPVKFPMAKKLGADLTINALKTNVVEEVLKNCPEGCKADVVVDCSGAIPSIKALFDCVKRDGIYGAIGLPPADRTIDVPWNAMVFNSLRLITSYSHDAPDWVDVIKYVADGTLDFSECVTNVIKLEDWAQVFKNTTDPAYIKGVIKPYLK